MIRRLIAATFALSPFAIHATTYSLEPDYTQTVFRWDHLGFSSPAAQLSQGEGTLEFDRADPTKSSVAVTFALATLHTGVSALDDHLNSEDFFDTKKFPTATFKSTRVEKGAKPGELKVTGNLNLHGVTKPVVLDVMLTKAASNPRTEVPTLGFAGTAILKRSDFGLGAYVPQVGDEIKMQITTQAVDANAYAKYLKAQAEEEASASKKGQEK